MAGCGEAVHIGSGWPATRRQGARDWACGLCDPETVTPGMWEMAPIRRVAGYRMLARAARTVVGWYAAQGAEC
jgi:hypothetical protein